MPKKIQLKRFSKQERRIFNAAMKLAAVKGEVDLDQGTYSLGRNGEQRCLSINHRIDDVRIRLVVFVMVGSLRSMLVRVSDVVSGSQARRFEAQIVNEKRNGRIMRNELVHAHSHGDWEQVVLKRGAYLSLRRRNLLRTNQ